MAASSRVARRECGCQPKRRQQPKFRPTPLQVYPESPGLVRVPQTGQARARCSSPPQLSQPLPCVWGNQQPRAHRAQNRPQSVPLVDIPSLAEHSGDQVSRRRYRERGGNRRFGTVVEFVSSRPLSCDFHKRRHVSPLFPRASISAVTKQQNSPARSEMAAEEPEVPEKNRTDPATK